MQHTQIDMDAKRISRTVKQAFEWLEKMGIDVASIPESDGMYTFLYNGILIATKVDVPNEMLFLSSPVLLSGKTTEENNKIFAIAGSMAHGKLKHCLAPFCMDEMSGVVRLYMQPKNTYVLRRCQLLQLLNEVIEDAETLQTIVNEVSEHVTG